MQTEKKFNNPRKVDGNGGLLYNQLQQAPKKLYNQLNDQFNGWTDF